MLDLLVEITDFELGKNLLRLALVIPSLFLFHASQKVFQTWIPFRFHALFIILDQLNYGCSMIETCFQYGQVFGIFRILFQITHTEVATINDITFIITFLSAQNIQQGSLSATILRNQTDALSFGYAKVYLLEQDQISKRLGQSVHLQVGIRHDYPFKLLLIFSIYSKISMRPIFFSEEEMNTGGSSSHCSPNFFI